MIKSIAQIFIFITIGILIAVPVTWLFDSSLFTFTLLFSAVQNIVKVFALLVINASKFSYIDIFIKVIISFLILKGILYVLFEIAPNAFSNSVKKNVAKLKNRPKLSRDEKKFNKMRAKSKKNSAKEINRQLNPIRNDKKKLNINSLKRGRR